METAVVTGGAGFLGSHLCDKLLSEGFKVICLDNLITGNLENISHLSGNENFLFLKQDITNYIFIRGRVDYILHFASPASPVDYLQFPIQTLKVGSLGTHKVLGLAKEKKARLLLASSSEVYGDPEINPQKENYFGNVNPVSPRGVYDEAKRFAEALTMAYHSYHNVDTRIARIFNTFGPRMRLNDGRAIPNFIMQALRNEPITIYGNGSQTRSFCYVTDMIEGLFKLLISSETDPVNIGNPDEITVKGIANEILKLIGSKSKLVFGELPANDPKVRRPDISKAKDKLGWEPKVKREAGLVKTIKYFKSKI
jgi:dTDP-glucose 4,6-dehydratase